MASSSRKRKAMEMDVLGIHGPSEGATISGATLQPAVFSHVHDGHLVSLPSALVSPADNLAALEQLSYAPVRYNSRLGNTWRHIRSLECHLVLSIYGSTRGIVLRR